jgi:hypothetical protein
MAEYKFALPNLALTEMIVPQALSKLLNRQRLGRRFCALILARSLSHFSHRPYNNRVCDCITTEDYNKLFVDGER